MDRPNARIGGGVDRPRYAIRYAIGVVIGSGLRLGVRLLPDSAVEAVKNRL